MFKRYLICALIGVCLAAEAQEFIVYKVSSRVKGFGAAYAADEDDDRGKVRNKWRGVFLYDLQTGHGAFVWRTRQRGEKIQETLSYGFSLTKHDIAGAGGKAVQVFTLLTSDNFNNLPDGDEIRMIYLRGGRVGMRNIGAGMRHPLARRPRGNLWYVQTADESYRKGNLTLRLHRRKTAFANEELGNFDGIGGVNLDDLIEYFETKYRSKNYIPESDG